MTLFFWYRGSFRGDTIYHPNTTKVTFCSIANAIVVRSDTQFVHCELLSLYTLYVVQIFMYYSLTSKAISKSKSNSDTIHKTSRSVSMTKVHAIDLIACKSLCLAGRFAIASITQHSPATQVKWCTISKSAHISNITLKHSPTRLPTCQWTDTYISITRIV